MYISLNGLYDSVIIRLKGSDYVSITATELKKHLSHYLMLSTQEDIYITKNGKVVAKLSNPMQNRVDIAKGLFGIIEGADDINLKEERLRRQ